MEIDVPVKGIAKDRFVDVERLPADCPSMGAALLTPVSAGQPEPACSPGSYPSVMRVSTARLGKEILDEEEATQPGADHLQAACGRGDTLGQVRSCVATASSSTGVGFMSVATNNQRPVPVGTGRVWLRRYRRFSNRNPDGRS